MIDSFAFGSLFWNWHATEFYTLKEYCVCWLICWLSRQLSSYGMSNGDILFILFFLLLHHRLPLRLNVLLLIFFLSFFHLFHLHLDPFMEKSLHYYLYIMKFKSKRIGSPRLSSSNGYRRAIVSILFPRTKQNMCNRTLSLWFVSVWVFVCVFIFRLIVWKTHEWCNDSGVSINTLTSID